MSLPAACEDLCDRGMLTVFYLGIEIEKRSLQQSGGGPADRSLPRSRQSDEDDVWRRARSFVATQLCTRYGSGSGLPHTVLRNL